MLAVGVMTSPFYLLLLTLAVGDWLLDWVFMGLFGWWCLPCAGVFIWLINIVMLPFTLMGWMHRFLLETFALVIDGWLLLLGGSGCYLRWGKDCWMNERFMDRSLRTFLDIPWFTTTIGDESFAGMFVRQISMPSLQKSSDILQVRRAARQPLMAQMPLYNSIIAPVS